LSYLRTCHAPEDHCVVKDRCLLHRFNLTDKEGSADRKVPVQPLVFYSKDGKVSRYNLRKVRCTTWLLLLLVSAASSASIIR
jgi:hypothetical protein